MKALFFVYTPFQFLVAQLIIKQENLKNSVLIKGYIGNNTHFLEIYNLLHIDSLWGRTYVMPDLPQWDGLAIRSIKDIKKTYSNFKKLKKIAKSNHIDTLFLGEEKNQSIRFTAKVFSHLGYKIAFFEEGLAHYINSEQSTTETFYLKFKILLRDILYYLPIYHIKFAQWRYQPGKLLDDKFPMDARYSILPVYHGEKERQVVVTFDFSDSLRKFMKSYIKIESQYKKVLILTQPLHEIYQIENFEKIYLNIISQALEEISGDVMVYVKYHPRDTVIQQTQLNAMLKNKNIKYINLSERINIPVEIYLQYIKFDKILFFSSSTYAYNGYLFPKQEFSCLLPKLNAECVKAAGHEFELYKNLMSFFEKISNISDKEKNV